MKDRRLIVGMIAAVLAIWLVGAAITKYSVEQMAYFAPIAVCVVGATAAVYALGQDRHAGAPRATGAPGLNPLREAESAEAAPAARSPPPAGAYP